MKAVFRALAAPPRRRLLDELFKEDGQTLSALERRLPMTRFGVMKHLRVLEEAGLVVTKKRGREKLHFLNPVPIRLVHDRWVSKYAEPWAAELSGLKNRLEATMEKMFEIYIKTTPERLWEAITDSELRRRYNFGVGVESDWTPGSDYKATAGSIPIAEGKNLSGAFQELALFPPLVIRMLRIGENTGALDRALANVTYFYNRDVRDSVERLQAAGALGARIMGGGFGGHVLGLLPPGAVPPAGSLEVRPGRGARLVSA